MKQLLFFSLLLLFIGQEISAQEFPSFSTHRNALGLRVGLNHLAMLDRNSSSLIYQGNLPVFGIDYQAFEENSYLTARLKAGRGSFYSKTYPNRTITFKSENIYGEVDTVSVPMRGTSTLGKFELGYLRKLNPKSQMEWAAGGLLSNEAYYQEGFTTPGLMNVASFSPAIQATWWESNYFLSVNVSVPLVALVSRSAWHNSVSQPNGKKLKGFLQQGTELETWEKHRQVRFSAALQRKMGDRWLAGLHYDFLAAKNSTPKELRLSQHEFSMSMQFIY